MNVIPTKPSRMAGLLAALFAGVLVGYACSEASRGEHALPGMPAARAGGVETAGPRGIRAAQPAKKVRRFGQVIGLKPEKKIIYNMLHAHPWKPINRMIKQCNIQNYSIYETELDGKLYLFAYFEYTGDDFEADMAQMARHKVTQEWWKLTDPCQIRLPGTPEGEQWRKIREVYHLD